MTSMADTAFGFFLLTLAANVTDGTVLFAVLSAFECRAAGVKTRHKYNSMKEWMNE